MVRRGFSIIEIITSLAVFSVLTVLLGLALISSQKVWRDVSGTVDADRQLKSICTRLRKELSGASFNSCAVAPVPAHLSGGGLDGDAIWFLSHVDADGVAHRKADGTPFWQHNVIYYLVVPNNHAGMYGMLCPGGVGPGGYDDRCPHKVLVRKVIDNPTGGSTNPADENTEDVLLDGTQIGTYLTQTNRFSTGGMGGESGFREARVVGRALLWMRFQLAPNPAVPNQIGVDARVVSLAAAQKDVAVGSASLAQSRYTTQWDFVLTPILP